MYKIAFPMLYIFSMSLDFIGPEFFGNVATIGKIIPAILLGWYLIKIKFRVGLKSYSFFIPLSLFAIYFSFSALWSPDIALAFPRVFSFLFLFISFWLILHYIQHQKNGLEYIFQTFVLLSVFIALLTLTNFAELFSGEAVVRTGAAGMHAIHTSMLILIGTVIMLIGVTYKTNNFKIFKPTWYVYLILFNIIALLSTATKTPFALLFFIIIAIYIYSPSNLIRYVKTKVILFIMLVLLVLTAINPYIGVLDNIYKRIDIISTKDNVVDKYGKVRFIIAEYAVANAIENPIMGVGLEGFKSNLIQSTNIDFRTSTHNTTLWSLAEGGLIGLLLWLNIVFLLFFSLNRLLKKTKNSEKLEIHELSVVSGMLMSLYLIASLSFNIEFNKFFWIIMATYASTKTALNLKLIGIKYRK